MIWTLIPMSMIYGLAAVLFFRRFSNEASIRQTVNRMMAHVLEFRLFLDSPALVLRAQKDLLRENLRLLRLILLPTAILAAIFIVLFPQLDAMYGHTPLKVGDRSVVTAQLDGADLVLQAPPGIEVETPAVRAVHDHQVSWRIRPVGQTSGALILHLNGRTLTRQIVAGSGLIYAATGPIDVRYPRTTLLGVNWMVWFFLISSTVAIVFKQ